MVTDKTMKHFQESKDGDYITILSCITASMKPLIIFKGQSVKIINNNKFYITASDNRWIDGVIVLWFDCFFQ